MPSLKPTAQDLSFDSSKHLSEFYTKSLNAQLLAYCTLRFPNDAWDFHPTLESWREFFVGDFACGDGSLLNALYLEIKNILVEQNTKVDASTLLVQFHRLFVDDLCFGFDVVKDSIIAAEEKLMALEPAIQKTCSNFYVLPLGSTPAIRLGSLDFLKHMGEKTPSPKMHGFRSLASSDSPRDTPIDLPPFQIVILNPPFARSCGDNLLFGTLPKVERDILTTELKRTRQEIGTTGIGQAGQAADFIYLAQQAVAPGGRFAFIVPKSFCFGPSWKKVRLFLAKNAEIEAIFFNYEYPHFGFSERTQLSECMVIARNTIPTYDVLSEGANKTLIVNILKSPNNVADLQSLQHQLAEDFVHKSEPVSSPQHTTLFIPQKLLRDYHSNWAQLAGFYSPNLCWALFHLIHDKILAIPGLTYAIHIPLTPLSSLGTIGYDRKQVTENTIDGKGTEQLLTVWGRDNRDFTSIQVKPTGFRHIKPGTNSRLFQDFQRSASHLLLPETVWLETTKVFSVYCTEKVVSNVFWTFIPDPALHSLDGKPIADWELEQILALWSNSTLGILLFLGMRQETRGPWVHWKKQLLGGMLTLDITQLTRSQVDSLLTSYSLCLTPEHRHKTPFMPAIVAGEKLILDLQLLQILQESARDPVSGDMLTVILGELYRTFLNSDLNPLGLA